MIEPSKLAEKARPISRLNATWTSVKKRGTAPPSLSFGHAWAGHKACSARDVILIARALTL